MYAGSSRLGADLSTDEVVEALRRYIARKTVWSRVITVTARRIARELGAGRDPMALAQVGLVLAELERLGHLRAVRSRRPKKYVVTELGITWAVTHAGDSSTARALKLSTGI